MTTTQLSRKNSSCYARWLWSYVGATCYILWSDVKHSHDKTFTFHTKTHSDYRTPFTQSLSQPERTSQHILIWFAKTVWLRLLWLQRIIPVLCIILLFFSVTESLFSHFNPMYAKGSSKRRRRWHISSKKDNTKSKWHSCDGGKTLNHQSLTQQILANSYLHNLKITRALPLAEQAPLCVCGTCICAKGHCGNAACLTLTWQERNYPAFRVFLASFHREFIQQLHLKRHIQWDVLARKAFTLTHNMQTHSRVAEVTEEFIYSTNQQFLGRIEPVKRGLPVIRNVLSRWSRFFSFPLPHTLQRRETLAAKVPLT